MSPVVYLNEFGSSVDHFLNLGGTFLSCNQMIWSRDSRCNVESASGKHCQYPSHHPNDRRTGHHPGTATANERGTNTFRATNPSVDVANLNPSGILGPH